LKTQADHEEKIIATANMSHSLPGQSYALPSFFFTSS
jgi:hypothetical protein